MKKASWSIQPRLIRRLAILLVTEAAYCFCFGYFIHWSLYFMILLNLALTYVWSVRSKEKYLTGFEDRGDTLVLQFMRLDFSSGTDTIAKSSISDLEWPGAGSRTRLPGSFHVKQNGEWKIYQLVGKEAATWLVNYVAETYPEFSARGPLDLLAGRTVS